MRSALETERVSTLRTLPSQLILRSLVAGRGADDRSSAKDVAGVAVAARLLLRSESRCVVEPDELVSGLDRSGFPPRSTSPSA